MRFGAALIEQDMSPAELQRQMRQARQQGNRELANMLNRKERLMRDLEQTKQQIADIDVEIAQAKAAAVGARGGAGSSGAAGGSTGGPPPGAGSVMGGGRAA